MRKKQRDISLMIAGFLLAGCFGTAAVYGNSTGESAEAIEALLATERALLAEDVDRYSELKRERIRLTREWRQLFPALDMMVEKGASGNAEELGKAYELVDRMEKDRQPTIAEHMKLVESIIERLRRIEKLEDRLGVLRERDQEESGALTGQWDVVFLPSGQRGSFNLEQTGTVVNGTYILDGGWTGSLQGTLVTNKVFLIRIDSRLGRSMELEGILSADGGTIRGTWLNYDLGGEGGANGQWTANLQDGTN